MDKQDKNKLDVEEIEKHSCEHQISDADVHEWCKNCMKFEEWCEKEGINSTAAIELLLKKFSEES